MSDVLEPNSVWIGSLIQRLDIEATYANDDRVAALLRDAHRALSAAVREREAAERLRHAAHYVVSQHEHMLLPPHEVVLLGRLRDAITAYDLARAALKSAEAEGDRRADPR